MCLKCSLYNFSVFPSYKDFTVHVFTFFHFFQYARNKIFFVFFFKQNYILSSSLLQYAGNKSLVWTRSGTQGDQWRHGQIFIKRTTRNLPLTVIFEGVRGVSFAGDIALDDIAFAKNGCPLPREFLHYMIF